MTVSLKILPAESHTRRLDRHERTLLESTLIYEEFAPVLNIVQKRFPDTEFLFFPDRPDRRGFIRGPVLRWIDGPSESEIYTVLQRDPTPDLPTYLVDLDRWDRIQKYVVSVIVGRSTTTFNTMAFSAEHAVEKNQCSIDEIIDHYGGRNKYSVRARKSPGPPPEIPWGFWDDPSDIERNSSECSFSPPDGPSNPQRNLIESLCLDLGTDPATHVSPRPHRRRWHWRHLRADRYREKKRTWIKPAWVGDTSWECDGQTYKVIFHNHEPATALPRPEEPSSR